MGNVCGSLGAVDDITKLTEAFCPLVSHTFEYRDIDDVYFLGEKLGQGAFSLVRRGINRETLESVAVKIVNRSELKPDDEAALLDEIEILRELQHHNIIRLYSTFKQPQHYYLVTELMEGGELFGRIVAKSFYNEKEARDTCKILFQAMAYCHSKKVAHRDLKPENLLLVSADSDSAIKIADFGFAKRVTSDACLKTQCGTPGYVAPEILEGVLYGTKADMWSLGVILYILLGGYPPFANKDRRELFRRIRAGQFQFHKKYWNSVSKDAKDLISSLLTVQPYKRLSADDALKSAWIRGDDKLLARQDLGKSLDNLKEFNARRRFKAGVQLVIFANHFKKLSEAVATEPTEDDDGNKLSMLDVSAIP